MVAPAIVSMKIREVSAKAGEAESARIRHRPSLVEFPIGYFRITVTSAGLRGFGRRYHNGTPYLFHNGQRYGICGLRDPGDPDGFKLPHDGF